MPRVLVIYQSYQNACVYYDLTNFHHRDAPIRPVRHHPMSLSPQAHQDVMQVKRGQGYVSPRLQVLLLSYLFLP